MKSAYKVKVLIVEDDLHLGPMLKDNLNLSNFDCDLFCNGLDGLNAFRNGQYDLCIFDVMLPVRDGFELGVEVRKINAKIPVIFLTARNSENDRIRGFKIGADDYVTKPFSFTELSLRIEAILKRTRNTLAAENEIYKAGIFRFDYTLRTLLWNQESRLLTFKEAEILKLFFSQPNILIQRNHIMKTVWHNDDYIISKSLDVYLTKIRKLLKPDHSIQIENLYGTGYMLVTGNV